MVDWVLAAETDQEKSRAALEVMPDLMAMDDNFCPVFADSVRQMEREQGE
jgi:hypothetical protein